MYKILFGKKIFRYQLSKCLKLAQTCIVGLHYDKTTKNKQCKETVKRKKNYVK